MKAYPVDREIRDCFEWLHRHPELSYQEHQTTKKIREKLEGWGVELLDVEMETGLIARIPGKGPGPKLALRADIDALPVAEESGLPYASTHEGCMHACGHDFHTSVLLGAARGLQAKAGQFPGELLLIFQPGEEAPGGALKAIATGALDEVDAFISLHTAPGLAVGCIAVNEGPVMAAVDRFEIFIEGEGTHAAYPHKGTDPVVVLAAVIQSLQTLISRSLNPLHANLLSITQVSCGNTWNVIPARAYLQGTVRTLEPEDRRLIEQKMRQMLRHLGEAYGADIRLNWIPSVPAVINTPALCRLARTAIEAEGLEAVSMEGSLGGEDFSLYLEHKPGLYMKVGTGGQLPLHHPGFVASQDALEPAIAVLERLALSCQQLGRADFSA